MLPETRDSLILRLPNRQDVAAWDEFVAIYEPLVYRLARSKGLQHADAQELVQEVFLAVSKAIERWQPGREHGRFRDWLFRISRNLVINFLSRRKPHQIGSGDSGINELLNAQVDLQSSDSLLFEQEYKREVFRHCATQVKCQVNDKTWQAFWLSSVELRAIAAVAKELSMSVGAVYIARSRVLAQLRSAAKAFLAEDESDWRKGDKHHG